MNESAPKNAGHVNVSSHPAKEGLTPLHTETKGAVNILMGKSNFMERLEQRRRMLEEQVHALFATMDVPPVVREWAERHRELFPEIICTVLCTAHPLEKWSNDNIDEMLLHHLECFWMQSEVEGQEDFDPEWMLGFIRFAATFRENERARQFTEALARLQALCITENDDVLPGHPLPLLDDPAVQHLPYLDVASGQESHSILRFLRHQPSRRLVYLNDNSFFAEKNFEEMAALSETSPAQCQLLTQDARSLPYDFPAGRLGTVKLSGVGKWLTVDDAWCRAMLNRVSPEQGKLLWTIGMPMEEGVEDFSWVDLHSIDDAILRRIGMRGERYVYWNIELLRQLCHAAEQNNARKWLFQAGSLDHQGSFWPGEMVKEEDIWTFACLLTRQG